MQDDFLLAVSNALDREPDDDDHAAGLDAGAVWSNGTSLEPGHLVGIARKRCSSAACRSVGYVNHPAHSPCQMEDCLNYQGTWHGSTHIVPCRGCGACLPLNTAPDAASTTEGR